MKLKLNKEENGVYQIEADGQDAGWIKVSDTGEMQFELKEAYRHKHLMKQAVYQLTPLLHQTCPTLTAHVDEDHTDAWHLLEHNGYQLLKQQDHVRTYVHHLQSTSRREEKADGLVTLYLAGGCFWGVERAFQQLKGVKKTCAGYVNGNVENPVYEQVCQGDTGFQEAVRVDYDPSVLSIDKLMQAYFLCIHPEQQDGQGNDIGSQYETGVYYQDEALLPDLKRIFADEKKKHQVFAVRLGPLKNFYAAEEYHQNYLNKHPGGYCHIDFTILARIRKLNESES